MGLSARSAEVIIAARRDTTYKRYQGYWNMFYAYCVEHNLEPFSVDIFPILDFVEGCRSDRDWSYSSVKLCLSSISIFRGRLENGTVFTHPLTVQYLKGAMKRSARAVARA